MREKAFETALFLLSVVLLAPAASARALKPAHVAGHRASAHPAEAVRVSARTHESSRSKAVQPRISKTGSAAESRTPDRRAERRVDARVVEEHRRDLRTGGGKAHRAPLEEARVHAKPLAKVPVATVAAPAVAAAAPLPPIEVHHNRKIHLAPDPAIPAPGAAVQPSPEDLSAAAFADAAAATDNNLGETDPAAEMPIAPVVRRPASVVERKLPPLPTVRPVATIVPDPVIEPVLYTARGHLIVPPAMKGSHEILLHQNEMADRDGLIRVQDDDDLDRLRTSKQLVALPTSEMLEVDERLPGNRRYCRPWTAQFLAAMARAHYARFHTPLQVNSAVRTVAFQERLRFTNGNAAPAEGETASPHLTGQAVDLAKRGLSMTEIAWMRGYLMPLVQQGKVDVEEEFQQACFHISVYKKYMPQAVPKREISPRRNAANALAAVIR